MASTYLETDKRAIAQNLIDTCGLHRALHAARQFGWHDIASEIAYKIDRQSAIETTH
ncbi:MULTISPECIES: hypothetical protein [Sneathiella]|jgi:hypothetical protein|uniref:hypothetical protein n=1 Tax=Sneathiella TaxID=510690 RepID=UPI00146D6783|nr:hypothetical protein [Sneathiella aquimaris]